MLKDFFYKNVIIDLVCLEFKLILDKKVMCYIASVANKKFRIAVTEIFTLNPEIPIKVSLYLG